MGLYVRLPLSVKIPRGTLLDGLDIPRGMVSRYFGALLEAAGSNAP